MKVKNRANLQTSIVKGLLGLFFVLSANQITAQKDTIWYGKNWKITNKIEASYYRIPVKEENGLFLVQDFYINGKKQMVGTSSSATKDLWQGKVTWYNQDGTILQQGNYIDNRLEGKFISFLNGKKLVADYNRGRFVSGKQNVNYASDKYYKELAGDTLVEIYHANDLNGRRRERYSVMNNNYYRNVKSAYYNENGELITELVYSEGAPMDGGEVYFYSGTNNIRSINYYKNRDFLGTTFYDSNGQVREKFYEGPDYKTVYFSESGKPLDSFSYQLKDGRLSPYNGKKYYYGTDKENNNSITINSIYNYLKGNLKWTKSFNEGSIFSYTQYDDSNRIDKVLFYNTDGTLKDSLLYKNYTPFKGTEYTLKKGIRKYSDGKIIEETLNYSIVSQVFKYRKGNIEKYYDKKGVKIAELKLKDEKYYKPEEGTQLNIDYLDRITTELVYKNEKRIKEAYISYSGKDTLGNKEETYYDEDGYDYLKKIKYYPSGKKKSEIDFKRYKEKYGKFYDEDGTLLGTYDYDKKDGKYYEFFYSSNEIKKMEKWNQGKLVRLLRYEEKYVRGNNEKEIFLVEDIDVSNKAVIYSMEGKLLSELIYKDGEPYEGTFYDYKSRTRSTFKDGKLDGKFEKFDYGVKVIESGFYENGLKEGKFTYYDYTGLLTHFINYTNGLKEGEATYFNKEGKKTTTMFFKEDLPFNGKQVIRDYRGVTTEEYKEGKLINKLVEKKTGDFFTTYLDSNEENIVVYYPASKAKKYEFTVKQGVLDGEVTRFALDGKKMHTGVFEKGRFVDGEIWILPRYDYDKDLEKMICKKNTTLYEVTFISKKGEVAFKATERPQAGIKSYLDKLNLGLDYINYQDLY